MDQENSNSGSLMIVAAEASSALYAFRLLEEIKKQGLSLKCFGIGDKRMVDAGFEALGRSEELAVVGLSEVLAHYPLIRRTFYKLIEECEKRRPAAVLLMDYPDFNLRLAKKIKKLGIPVIYYISPQVWAWRKSRIHVIKDVVKKMLVLFPFEEAFYKDHGVPVDFVGHPLLDEIHPSLFSDQERKRHREKFGILEQDQVVALMPGSRNSELKNHMKIQIEVAEKMYANNPRLKFILPVAPTLEIDQVRAFLPHYSIPLTLVKDDPFRMIRMSDVILCASGTATLMVGLMETPMVIMYKMNGFSAFLAKMFVKGTSHFGLINLVLGEKAVPEFFQEEASVQNLSAELNRFLTDKEYQSKTKAKLATAKFKLGQEGATKRVMNAIKGFL